MLSPILITRPKGQQDNLTTAITNAGAQTIHYPVMAIHALNEQQHAAIIHRTAQQFAQLEQYQHIIFISSNAVHFAQHWLNDWPSTIHCYAIGTTTAAALSKQGIRCATHTATAMNSETLLQHRALQQVNGQHILIVRGIGGREVLAEQLRGRGALVDYAECYYRTIVDRPSGELGQLIIDTGIQAVIVHSGKSLDYFVKLVGDQYRSQVQCLPLLVPSERIAQQARQYGFNAVITADNASSEAMVAVLKQLGTA